MDAARSAWVDPLGSWTSAPSGSVIVTVADIVIFLVAVPRW